MFQCWRWLGQRTCLPFRLNSLVRVENPNDRWCLARAVLIGLRYRECGENRTDRDFFSYIHSQRDHGELAQRLLSDAGISTTKEFYTLADASKIQDLINARIGAQEVRLVIFSSAKNNGIIWKGWNGMSAKYNLCLYHTQDHFSFLSSPRALLKVTSKIVSYLNLYLTRTVLVKWFLRGLWKKCRNKKISHKRMCCSMSTVLQIWLWFPMCNSTRPTQNCMSGLSFYISECRLFPVPQA